MNRPLPDNHIPIEIGKTTSFIYKDVYHPITWIGNEPYRPRVETMVISQGRKLWIKFHNKINPERLLDYEFPGGSLDQDCTKEQQAENEVNEEALISIKNLSYSGVQYYETFSDRNVNKYSREFPIGYRGFITDVFVAEYDGKFDKKNVEAKDLDPEMFNNGKFIYISGIIDKLSYDHLFAIQNTNLVDDNIKYLIDRYLSSKNVSLENVQLRIITEAPKEDDEDDEKENDNVKDYTSDVNDDNDTADVEPEPSGSDTNVEVNDDNEETDIDEDEKDDNVATNDTTTDNTTSEENNDDVKDYTSDADDDAIEEDTPDATTDEPEPQNDEPEDTSTDTTSTDTNDTTDTGDDSTDTDDTTTDESGDEDESMDYTDNADSDSSGDASDDSTEDDTSVDDTSDSTEDEESTDTEDSDKNNNVKNYNLLLDYQKLHRTIESISDKLEYTIFDNHIMNSVISEVIQNLSTLNIHIVKYIEYSFKNDYETNLYNYNVYVQTLRMNLLLLGDAVKLNSEK